MCHVVVFFSISSLIFFFVPFFYCFCFMPFSMALFRLFLYFFLLFFGFHSALSIHFAICRFAADSYVGIHIVTITPFRFYSLFCLSVLLLLSIVILLAFSPSIGNSQLIWEWRQQRKSQLQFFLEINMNEHQLANLKPWCIGHRDTLLLANMYNIMFGPVVRRNFQTIHFIFCRRLLGQMLHGKCANRCKF